jgi:hypothetical protein
MPKGTFDNNGYKGIIQKVRLPSHSDNLMGANARLLQPAVFGIRSGKVGEEYRGRDADIIV